MRTSQLLLRSGPIAAAVAALAATPAVAASGISVSTTGSTVSVTTSACTQVNGSWGTASLLNSSQANFAQGRQVTLSGTNSLQSAAWSNVSPGTYTVVVMCSNNATAGTQSVIVSTASTPTISATASPSRGVMGGLGGGIKDYGPLTLGAGAALVGIGGIAAAWFLRRRSKPYRL
ncbi:hypothetical protein [Streptomyces justiciae]|uniref:Secreted protein n=1 Tax=Streptomyces justiciae TaxID=2780140 RepID=A0ABU3LV66_9ACTN|nr:hypothetical protein [Streptomyces justiciae]MCW8376530.1 hypothetical protein [Streptomyces justiciae]MDT7843135.1 hypothetical protein [Streptomyces justiciae]